MESPKEKLTVPEKKSELIEVVGFENFKKALEGWRTLDADICGNCWGAYLNQFDKKQQGPVKDGVKSTKDFAKFRRILDGWFVECDRCRKIVSAKDPTI